MTIIVFYKTDIAVKQLETAIDLFLNQNDYICAITLAGASEGILGKLVERVGKKPAIKSLIESLKVIYNINISDKELISKHLNHARNTLKHANVTDEDKVELYTQTEAISMILRAIYYLIRLDKSVSYNTPDFFGWLNKHRK